MFSAGLEKSPMLAIVMSHLKVGAQKKMVNGPAGCRRRLRRLRGGSSLRSGSLTRFLEPFYYDIINY
jgi:hypothetical protein